MSGGSGIGKVESKTSGDEAGCGVGEGLRHKTENSRTSQRLTVLTSETGYSIPARSRLAANEEHRAAVRRTFFSISDRLSQRG